MVSSEPHPCACFLEEEPASCELQKIPAFTCEECRSGSQRSRRQLANHAAFLLADTHQVCLAYYAREFFGPPSLHSMT
jgi:hypothetical protein